MNVKGWGKPVNLAFKKFQTKITTAIRNNWTPAKMFANGEVGIVGQVYNPDNLRQRRNQFTYSEDFTNAAWAHKDIFNTVSRTLGDGIGDLLIPNANATSHGVPRSNGVVGGGLITWTVRAKAAGYDWLAFQAGAVISYFNIGAGQLGTIAAGFVATIFPVVGLPGYYDCTLSGVASSNNTQLYIAANDNVVNFAGNTVNGVRLARAQVEWYTAVASNYQKITDWNNDYLESCLSQITMWQDNTGTTPVTAVEQTVGLLFDTSLPIVIGPDLVVNSDLSTDTWWTKGTDWTITNGVASRPVSSGSSNLSRPALFTLGKCYRIRLEILSLTGSCIVYAGGSAFHTFTTTGKKIAHLRCAGDTSLYIQASGAGSAVTVDNITAEEISGNHVTQATQVSRFVLKARYNLYLKSEQINDAAWTKANCTAPANGIVEDVNNAVHQVYNAATFSIPLGTSVVLIADVVPSGRTWAFLNIYSNTDNLVYFNLTGAGSVGSTAGAVTATRITKNVDGSYRLYIRATTAVGTAVLGAIGGATGDGGRTYFGTNGLESIKVLRADFRTYDDAQRVQPEYQRVNTATDYDTKDFIHYLFLDGSDDSAQSPIINFSVSDKITLFAAVTKLNEITGILFELGPVANSTDGTFYLAAPSGAGAANYAHVLRGTSAVGASTTGTYPAPSSNVLQLDLDIATAIQTLNVDGVQASLANTSVGTGNFSNQVFNIGRRNNASLAAGARIYAFILRSGATTGSTAIQAKKWLAKKAGLIRNFV